MIMDDEFDGARLDGHVSFDYTGGSVVAWSVTFIVLCTLVVGLRFLTTKRRPNTAGVAVAVEHWLVLAALTVEIGLCVDAICSVVYGGVGRHEAYISQYTPGSLTGWAKTRFVGEVLYALVSPLAKTVLLLLYLRLFSSTHSITDDDDNNNGIRGPGSGPDSSSSSSCYRWLRLTTYFLMVYIWLWGITAVFVAVFQCRPVSYQWTRTGGNNGAGYCIDQLTYHRWIAIPNLTHTVVMLAVPIPVFWDLEIGVCRKIASTVLFLMGLVVCVASFVRLAVLTRLDQTNDKTWESAKLYTWTLIETGFLLICACLPSLWPLAQHIAATTWKIAKREGNNHAISPSITRRKHHDNSSSSSSSSKDLNPSQEDVSPLTPNNTHHEKQKQKQKHRQRQKKVRRRSQFMCCASSNNELGLSSFEFVEDENNNTVTHHNNLVVPLQGDLHNQNHAAAAALPHPHPHPQPLRTTTVYVVESSGSQSDDDDDGVYDDYDDNSVQKDNNKVPRFKRKGRAAAGGGINVRTEFSLSVTHRVDIV